MCCFCWFWLCRQTIGHNESMTAWLNLFSWSLSGLLFRTQLQICRSTKRIREKSKEGYSGKYAYFVTVPQERDRMTSKWPLVIFQRQSPLMAASCASNGSKGGHCVILLCEKSPLRETDGANITVDCYMFPICFFLIHDHNYSWLITWREWWWQDSGIKSKRYHMEIAEIQRALYANLGPKKSGVSPFPVTVLIYAKWLQLMFTIQISQRI